MSDRLVFALLGGSAVLMIALALVWPQGQGARSPWPFGHAPPPPPSAARRAAPASGAPSILGLSPQAAPAAPPRAQTGARP